MGTALVPSSAPKGPISSHYQHRNGAGTLTFSQLQSRTAGSCRIWDRGNISLMRRLVLVAILATSFSTVYMVL